jgi:glycosyltransferase involved in cell wall biosynthesis
MNISVIIPCRNAGAYLAQALHSVLRQSLPPAEIIVVDDGSGDGSLATAASFAPAVTAFSHPCGCAPTARNFGYARSSGDAVMFLDADDVLRADALAALAAALPRGGLACCPWLRMELDGGKWLGRPASCAGRKPGDDPLMAWLRGWYHPPCSVLWTREGFEATGGWDPAARVNNDGDLMMRAMVIGVPLVTTTDGAAYYRRLPAGEVSLSSTRFTPEAMRSRIRIVARIARQLRDRNRLAAYRPALGDALRRLAGDCAVACPELEGDCRALHAEFGDSGWRAWVRRGAARSRARLGGWRRRLATAAGPTEVTIGLE